MKQKVITPRNYGIIYRRIVYRCCVVFAICQLLLILASWLLAAALPDIQLRSLLSPAGIRWFFGGFPTKLATPLLVYLIVAAIGWSSVSASGLWLTIRKFFTSRRSELTSQQRFALKAIVVLLLLQLTVMLCLVLLPQAILLSITGEMFPSSFSASFIPVLSFMATTSGILYGMLSGRFHSIFDIGECMTYAGKGFMPLLLLYVLGAELYYSFIYVFII